MFELQEVANIDGELAAWKRAWSSIPEMPFGDVDLDREPEDLTLPDPFDPVDENGTIKLPIIVYFDVDHKDLPSKKVFGVLLRIGTAKKTKQPRHSNSSIFIIAKEKDPPHHLRGDALLTWACDPDNCPLEFRYRTLSYAITALTYFPDSPYHIPTKRYRLWKKCWKFGTRRIGTVLSQLKENDKFDPKLVPHSKLPYRRLKVDMERTASSRKSNSSLDQRIGGKRQRKNSGGNEKRYPKKFQRAFCETGDSDCLSFVSKEFIDSEWRALTPELYNYYLSTE